MIRNLIFDWSGTLVDDLPVVLTATNYVFRKAGVAEMTLDQFRSEFRLPFRQFYDRYVPHVPLPQLEKWFHECFIPLQGTVLELPHAREFMTFCRAQGMRTFLLSSVHRLHYQEQVSRLGFQQFLDEAYIEVWDKRTKIREIIQQHQLHPPDTLFVGDMQHDIETAQWGGVLSCAVLTGFTKLAELEAGGPDLIVEHLGELQQILEHYKLELPSKVNSCGHG